MAVHAPSSRQEEAASPRARSSGRSLITSGRAPHRRTSRTSRARPVSLDTTQTCVAATAAALQAPLNKRPSTKVDVSTLEAPAGELAFVAYAAQPDAGAPMPALLGVQLVTPLAVVSLGPVPAGGQLVFTAAAAPGPGQSAATFFSQAAFFGSGLALASPSVTTLVAMPL